nr:MAG TPA: hypothetical protein [Caudoviricetes sp.]
MIVFLSSLDFGERQDGRQNMDDGQCLLSLSLHCRMFVKSFVTLTFNF